MSDRGDGWVRLEATGEFFNGPGRISAVSIRPGSAGHGVTLYDAKSARPQRNIGRFSGSANRTDVFNFPGGIKIERGCWGVFDSNTDEVTVFFRYTDAD